LNLLRIDEFDDDQSDQCSSHPSTQRERHEKHTGRFADAAPRLALSNIEMEYPNPSILQTKGHHKDDRNVTQSTSNDDIPAATIASEALGSGPTDAELTSKIRDILITADFKKVSVNMIRQQLERIYGIDLTPRSDFIRTTVGVEIGQEPMPSPQMPAATIASETEESGPTDAELTSKVHELLMGADLMKITKKQLREQLEGIYGVDLTSRRDFLSKTIDAELIRIDSTLNTPSPQEPTDTIALVGSQPTDAELVNMIHEILMVADFHTATKKKIRQQMEGIYGVSLSHQRDFISRTIDEELSQRATARPPYHGE